MRVRLSADGIVEFADEISRKGGRARRPEPALRSDATRRVFEDAAARKWRSGLRRGTSREWRLEKLRRGMSTRTMVATGESLMAVTRRVGAKASAVTFSAFSGEVRFGVRRGRSSLYHLQVHASGYRSTRGRVPPRRVIVANRPVKDGVASIVTVYIATGRIPGRRRWLGL